MRVAAPWSLNDRVVTEDFQRLIAQAARSDAPVLIEGGAKSDNEVVARLLHTQSRRAGGPFIIAKCGTVSRDLLESKFFGNETDMYTDPTAGKPGLIAAAESGTLFIDELGDMSGPMQIELLRLLDRGEYRPVGSTRRLHADVRIVGATTQDLQARVLKGRFSDDLLYRISAITLQIPPLPTQITKPTRPG